VPDHVIAFIAPEPETADKLLRLVHVIPSEDVAHLLDAPTAQKIDPVQLTASMFAPVPQASPKLGVLSQRSKLFDFAAAVGLPPTAIYNPPTIISKAVTAPKAAVKLASKVQVVPVGDVAQRPLLFTVTNFKPLHITEYGILLLKVDKLRNEERSVHEAPLLEVAHLPNIPTTHHRELPNVRS
jgi:hypothetical protein